MIITIDGPSGTGKSTVARKVAGRIGITYFDTGAMYRAVTWALLEKAINFNDSKSVEELLVDFIFDILKREEELHYFVNGTDVTKAIRSQKVTEAVSQISAMPKVREKLWDLQRAYAEKESAVFEGRDMGSVVFPEAEVKIFLDASPKVRAKRRLEEMRRKSPDEAKRFDATTMEAELDRRDSFDSSRALAPLQKPKGSKTINTSKMSIDEVVEEIVEYQHKKVQKLVPCWLRCKAMGPLYRFVLFSTWCFFKLFLRHKIYGLEHYVKRAAVIAPNHTSYLDPPLTATSWPQEVHFLAREGLFKPFLFGRFIRAVNSHPVSGDVGDVKVFKTIIGLLKEGKQIILFPEGERTDGSLGEFKPGIAMLVLRSNAVIIPTYIHGADKAWGRDRKFPKLFGKTACVFGSLIKSESYSHLEKKEAQLKMSQQLKSSIVALKAWYDAGAKGIPP